MAVEKETADKALTVQKTVYTLTEQGQNEGNRTSCFYPPQQGLLLHLYVHGRKKAV